jgi:hypothetical protein
MLQAIVRKPGNFPVFRKRFVEGIGVTDFRAGKLSGSGGASSELNASGGLVEADGGGSRGIGFLVRQRRGGEHLHLWFHYGGKAAHKCAAFEAVLLRGKGLLILSRAFLRGLDTAPWNRFVSVHGQMLSLYNHHGIWDGGNGLWGVRVG